MRDIIWTIIVIWLVYRFVQLFKTVSPAQAAKNEVLKQPSQKPERRSDLDSKGEYVDFEEIR